MSDAIVSAVLQQLMTILDREVEQEVRLVFGVKKEVEKMSSTFRTIQAVMVDAENRHFKEEAVKVWLDKLKHISFDIDDVLDQWNTAVLKSEIESPSTPSLPTKVCSCIPIPCSCFGGVARRRDIALKIRELNEKLQAIAREKDDFPIPLDVGLNTSTDLKLERPKTTSLIDESDVCGRDNDKDELIRLLLSDNNGEGGSAKGIPIIAVVGMGGLGKTTLAQLAYNNDEVKNHFLQRIWVCVSDPFDEIRIAKAILEALKGTPSNFNEPESLFQEICQNIEGKKFLLVLDDVWTEDEKKWKPLKLSLSGGSQESKILVTTRKEKVASILGCTRPFLLGVLSDEDGWSLFSKIAFSERSNQDHKSLESIGRKLVGKCAGLPLAIKTLAGLLRFKGTEEQWRRVLVSKMWNLKEVEQDVYVPLLLSYYDLPLLEKQCFRYCVIFPKDHRIERDELIKLWIAQGFLGGTCEVNDLEIIGEECFNNLAMRCFFQQFEKDEIDGSIIDCKMHDIVHDFAQFLTKTECVLAESDGSIEVHKRVESSHENVRHLTLINPPSDRIPILDPFKKLRSFLMRFSSDSYEPTLYASFPKLFHQLIHLRMLSFHCELWKEECVFEIPKEIRKLMQLRYLSLEGNIGLVELPESLCDLWNLQTLNIRRCGLRKLPHGMAKLINLRYLQNAGTYQLLMPKRMQRLTCLHALESFFVVKKGEGIETETTFSLEDLGELIHLRGHLEIKGLGNVRVASEARAARLSTKAGLHSLSLGFDGGDDHKEQRTMMEDETSVLQALHPPQHLQFLGIGHCKGPAFPFPVWMTSLTSLKSVELYHCANWESLPPMGKLLSLEFLSIWHMKKVKKVGEEFLGVETSSSSSSSPSINHNIAFPNLKELEFISMYEWEEWECDEMVLGDRGGDGSSSSNIPIIIMPKLQRLLIYDCQVLKTLPRHLLQSRALRELEIEECDILYRRFNRETGEDWPSISHIPTLRIEW